MKKKRSLIRQEIQKKIAPLSWISHYLFNLKSYFCYEMSMSYTLNIVNHAKRKFDNTIDRDEFSIPSGLRSMAFRECQNI